MNRRHVNCLRILSLLIFTFLYAEVSVLGGQEEEALFERLYGKRKDDVSKSNDKVQHLQFGTELYEQSAKEEALEEILEDHAIEHLRKSGKKEALDMILEIHRDDIDDFPQDKTRYLKLMREDADMLHKKISYRDKENRSKVARFLAEIHLLLADALEEDQEYAEAASTFRIASFSYRKRKEYDTAKECDVRTRENVAFDKEKQAFLKALEQGKAQEEATRFSAGVELFKSGQYRKAGDLLAGCKDAPRILSVIALMSGSTSEKVTPAGVRESHVLKLLEKTKGKDATGLVGLLGRLTPEPELEKEAVVCAGMIHYGETNWDYLNKFSQKAKALVHKKGKSASSSTKDRLAAARLFDELATGEKRRYVRKGLLNKALELYTQLSEKATKESFEKVEADMMTGVIQKKLDDSPVYRMTAGLGDMDFKFIPGLAGKCTRRLNVMMKDRKPLMDQKMDEQRCVSPWLRGGFQVEDARVRDGGVVIPDGKKMSRDISGLELDPDNMVIKLKAKTSKNDIRINIGKFNFVFEHPKNQGHMMWIAGSDDKPVIHKKRRLAPNQSYVFTFAFTDGKCMVFIEGKFVGLLEGTYDIRKTYSVTVFESPEKDVTVTHQAFSVY